MQIYLQKGVIFLQTKCAISEFFFQEQSFCQKT